MRLFEERRDTEAGQKVGRRGERKREGRVRERERDTGKEQEMDGKEDTNWDMPLLTKDCVITLRLQVDYRNANPAEEIRWRPPVHTCPCRSVLSSMRAHVNVWAPSAARQYTRPRSDKCHTRTHTNSRECNAIHSVTAHADTNHTSSVSASQCCVWSELI